MAHTMGTVPVSEEVLAIWRTRHVGPRNWQLAVKQDAAPVGLGNLIAPTRSALLIVDMQNDFCHAEGGMAKRRGADISTNQSIIGPIARMLNAARSAGVMVIHIRAVYGPQSASPTWIGGDTEASIALELCLPGSWGAEIVDELAPVASEPVVVKHRYSAFLDTSLETLLRSNRIGTVVVVGTATMACVESTVRDAMMRDYRVVVPRGCVASRGHMKHLDDAAMETMGLFFADVVDDDDVLGIWTELQSSASEKQAVS
jgi:ureidoacrylate peracid hydrolase